jgi:puromycin-sensitive aminopeptidase
MKATFKMTVNVPKDRVALSNMPVESENVVGNTKRVSFEVSPKMSTYLVALVVGELEYLESEMPSG